MPGPAGTVAPCRGIDGDNFPEFLQVALPIVTLFSISAILLRVSG
jgi:hypothetical protein